MMLNEKAAWRYLAREFEKYAQGVRQTRLTEGGLCYAVIRLERSCRITLSTRGRMEGQLKGIRRCVWFWFPRDRDGAAKRVMICTLLAEG